MGAMKNLLADFCEVVYPADPIRQEQLARDILSAEDLSSITTVADFRAAYEKDGYVPRCDVGWVSDVVEQARREGFFDQLQAGKSGDEDDEDRCHHCHRPTVDCPKCGNHQYCAYCDRCNICGPSPRRRQ